MKTASELPVGWTEAPFGALWTSSQNGCGARRGSGEPTVVLRLADVSIDGRIAENGLREIPLPEAERRKYALQPGDLLAFRVNGSPHITGQVVRYPGPPGYAFCDHFIRIRVIPKGLDPQFAALAFRVPPAREEVAAKMVSTAGQNTVSQASLAAVRFRIAPFAEQRRIAEAVDSYFTRLDDAAATLERVQRNLKRYRASVLKAAVEGRLVPTEAELARAEGRDYEPASVLLERILAERRRRWEEAELAKMKAKGKSPKDDKWKVKYVEPVAPDTSELPDLPEGWCWASMDQLGVVSGGLTQNAKRELLSTQIPFLRVANVYSNELRLDEIKTIGVSAAEVDRVRLVPGDLLIVEGNGSIEQIGRVALWDGSIEPCLHQNHLIKVRFAPVGLGQWSLCWLLAPSGRVAIERAASSTSGLHTLSLSKVQRLPVPLAPLAEQSRVTDEVDRLLTVATAAAGDMSRNAHRASRLRQSILKWAFEGRLVDQDPNDEPASALLDRIRAEREAAPSTRRRAPSSRARGTLTSPCPDQPST
jgi:type I restriction enzyme S subunit